MLRFCGTRNVATRSPDPPLDVILGQLNPIHNATQSFQSNVQTLPSELHSSLI